MSTNPKPKPPRGIRNHNPDNIRWGDPWQGLVPETRRTDAQFCQFTSAAFGIRALARTLITYQDKHAIRTLRGLITRWAPPVENNTAAYIASVARQTGHDPDEELNLHHHEDILTMVQAIIRHENGRGPEASPNTWYAEETVNKGLTLAGVVRHTPTAAKIPVTKETIGATATGGAGIAQIADVVASVPVETIASANEYLSSGSGIRLGIGVALIAVAVFIAWSQVKRFQAGTL